VYAVLGLAAVVSVALLGFSLWRAADDHDLHAGATIDGAAFSRADLRNRLAVLQAVDAARAEVSSLLVMSSTMTAAEQANASAQWTGRDYAAAVVDSLVREAAVRREAAALGVAAPSADPRDVLDAAAYAPFARHVRWLELTAPLAIPDQAGAASDWPRAPAGPATSPTVLAARAAAMERAAALAATTSAADLVAAARGAGWDARAFEAWIAEDDPADGVPAVVLDALRDPGLAKGAVAGPMADDATGGAALGVLMDTAPRIQSSAVTQAIARIKLDDGALRTWAEGQLLERAVREAKLAAWTTRPSTVITVRELVAGQAGAAAGPGPYAGLAHLVLSSLPASELPAGGGALPTPFGGTTPVPTPWPTQPGQTPRPTRAGPSPGSSPSAAGLALAAQLNALPPDQRLARWGALVASANASGAAASDPLRRSGDMGWRSRDGLAPAVADAVLTPAAPAGTVVGPVETLAGPELFLVRGQFPGVLDEHASGVLTQAATANGPAALAAVAAAAAPGAEALRWDPGIARSALELADNGPARAALLDGALGARGAPYILDGEVLVGVPLSRAEAVPAGQVLARVRVEAFALWLADRMAALRVEVDRDPFGLGASPAATPAAAPTLAIPTMAPPPSAGLP
jgi:hypothetical protein